MKRLNDKTADLIQERVGQDIKTISSQGADETDAFIEKKIGKKLSFPEPGEKSSVFSFLTNRGNILLHLYRYITREYIDLRLRSIVHHAQINADS